MSSSTSGSTSTTPSSKGVMSAPPTPDRRLPWGHCHFRGQDLLAVGLGPEVLIVEAGSLLLLQRLEQREGPGVGTPVASVRWLDHTGALAVVWEGGTVGVFENPSVVGLWEEVAHEALPGRKERATTTNNNNTTTGPQPSSIPKEAMVSVAWSAHYLLVVAGPSLTLFAYANAAERSKASSSSGGVGGGGGTTISALHHRQELPGGPHLVAAMCPNGHYIATSYMNLAQVDIWEASSLSLLCTLEHESVVHIVSWRPGLPGVLAILLTACLTDNQLHVWAEGKGSTNDPHIKPPPSTTSSGSRGPPPLGLWTRVTPFSAAGGAVAWLQWANHGSTRASQHLASRVRHHGLEGGGGSSGGQMLKSVAGSWLMGIEADGSIRLWCILNNSSHRGGGSSSSRLPDQPDVVEVVAKASWEAWRASSLGVAMDEDDRPAFNKDGILICKSKRSSYLHKLLGPQVAATGFFDPRGVGIPAEISLVVKPDFLRDSGKLILTTLGTLLTSEGELKLTSVWGAALDTSLLLRPSPPSSSSASLSSAGVVVHPSLPFSAQKQQLGTIVATTYLGSHLCLPLYPSPTQPLPLPVPLGPIRLPEGRTADHLLWLHDSTRLEKQSPCLLVVDSEGGLFLYQAQLHHVTLPEPPPLTDDDDHHQQQSTSAGGAPRARRCTFEALLSTSATGISTSTNTNGPPALATSSSSTLVPSMTTSLSTSGAIGSSSSGGAQFFEVTLRPDPVYGLGMRLERREADIRVASFKRQPSTGAEDGNNGSSSTGAAGLLPAESSGSISVGDALVGANGYSLEGMDLEQAVGIMRTVGSAVTGEVTLRFRRSVLSATATSQAGGGEEGVVQPQPSWRRAPSIYGIDFGGSSSRPPSRSVSRSDSKVSAAEVQQEGDQASTGGGAETPGRRGNGSSRSSTPRKKRRGSKTSHDLRHQQQQEGGGRHGVTFKWHLCGRGQVPPSSTSTSGGRLEAACVVPSELEELPPAASAESRKKSQRLLARGSVRVGTLVAVTDEGSATARVMMRALEVVVDQDGNMSVEELVRWSCVEEDEEGHVMEKEGGPWKLLQASHHLGQGLAVVACRGRGHMHRWELAVSPQGKWHAKAHQDLPPLPPPPVEDHDGDTLVVRGSEGRYVAAAVTPMTPISSKGDGLLISVLPSDASGLKSGSSSSGNTPASGSASHPLHSSKKTQTTAAAGAREWRGQESRLLDMSLSCSPSPLGASLVLGVAHHDGGSSSNKDGGGGGPSTSSYRASFYKQQQPSCPSSPWTRVGQSPPLPAHLLASHLLHAPPLLLSSSSSSFPSSSSAPLPDSHPSSVLPLALLHTLLPYPGPPHHLAPLSHFLEMLDQATTSSSSPGGGNTTPLTSPPSSAAGLTPGLWEGPASPSLSSLTPRFRASAERLHALLFPPQPQPPEDQAPPPPSPPFHLPAPLPPLSLSSSLVLWALLHVYGSTKPQVPPLDPLARACLLALDLRKALIPKLPEHAPRHCCGAALLAALLSTHNDRIVQAVLPTGPALDFNDEVRRLWLPLWCRSLPPLRRFAEELAQSIFRQRQDLMLSAIFYLAAGKKALLRQLAKTAKDDKRGLDKLMQQDLKSERGKQVAEKNAFHLLRMRQYSAAAAVFLLPEPPSLREALDVMVRHMRDPSLALLVARLLDGEEEEGVLGPAALEVMEMDVLPHVKAEGEVELQAMALLWLGRGGEAVDVLSHKGEEEALPPTDNSNHQQQGKKGGSTGVGEAEEALLMVNDCVGHVLAPVTAMQHLEPSLVLAWKGVANMAARQGRTPGLELAALDSLEVLSTRLKLGPETCLDVMTGQAKPQDFLVLAAAQQDQQQQPPSLSSTSGGSGSFTKSAPAPLASMTGGGGGSSIFDAFDAPPGAPPRSSSLVGDAGSSIFDQFDAPPRPPPQQQQASSSIFDAFDVPPPPAPVASTSIFDQFDMPPQPPPPQTAAAVSSSSGLGTGSIFDQFEAPPPPPAPSAPTVSSSSSGLGTGSIFDEFDAPPRPPPTTTSSTSATSGLGSGSLFDQFDVPPPAPSQPSSSAPSTTTSSIFDQYEIGVPKFGGGGAAPPLIPTSSIMAAAEPLSARSRAVTPTTTATSKRRGRLLTRVSPSPESASSFVSRDLLGLAVWAQEAKTALAATRLLREIRVLLQTWLAWSPLFITSLPGKGAGGGLNLLLPASGGPHSEPPPPPPASQTLTDQASALVDSLCNRYDLSRPVLLFSALRLLLLSPSPASPPPLISHHVILLHLLHRPTSVNIVVRRLVRSISLHCSTLARPLLTTTTTSNSNQGAPPLAPPLSEALMQELVGSVWDLETCIFLHLQGAIKLSARAIQEATVGARMALLLLAFRRNYAALQLLVTHLPHTNLVSGAATAMALEEEEGGPYLQQQSSSVPPAAPPGSAPQTDDEDEDDDEAVVMDPLTSMAATVSDIRHHEEDNNNKQEAATGQESIVKGGGVRRGSKEGGGQGEAPPPAVPPSLLHQHLSSLKLTSDLNKKLRAAFVKAEGSSSTSNHSRPSSMNLSQQMQKMRDRVLGGTARSEIDSQQQLHHSPSSLTDSRGGGGGGDIYYHSEGGSSASTGLADDDLLLLDGGGVGGGAPLGLGGYHFRVVSRSHAEALLLSKPAGSFLLRPKGNHLDLVLTVKTRELGGLPQLHGGGSRSAGGGGGSDVGGGSSSLGSGVGAAGSSSFFRHYVIRVISPPSVSGGSKDATIAAGAGGSGSSNTSTAAVQPPLQFRCGAVGPYEDLEDLLLEVSSCLPEVGLRMRFKGGGGGVKQQQPSSAGPSPTNINTTTTTTSAGGEASLISHSDSMVSMDSVASSTLGGGGHHGGGGALQLTAAWQHNYFALSPNGALLRSLVTHAGLTLTSLEAEQDTTPRPSGAAPEGGARGEGQQEEGEGDRQGEPPSPLRNVVDLLVLRAVLRQAADVLRVTKPVDDDDDDEEEQVDEEEEDCCTSPIRPEPSSRRQSSSSSMVGGADGTPPRGAGADGDVNGKKSSTAVSTPTRLRPPVSSSSSPPSGGPSRQGSTSSVTKSISSSSISRRRPHRLQGTGQQQQQQEDDDHLQSFFRVTFEPEAAFLGPIPPGPVPPSASVVAVCPPTGSASAGLLVPLARWVDVLERQLQAALAPRIAFRLNRDERTKAQASALPNDPAAARSLPAYGDHMIKLLMKDDCEVQFHHIKVGVGHRTVQVVSFLCGDAASWMVKHGYEPNVAAAKRTLADMEACHVIQRVRQGHGLDEATDRHHGPYYRYVDPWQVDPHNEGAVGILSEGMVGRMCFEPVRAGETAEVAELERMGPSVVSLWTSLRGDAWVKETIALAVPPLEREAGPACRPDSSIDAFSRGDYSEPYTRAITRHLYRNALFSRLHVPFRFMALLQADVTDLKVVVGGAGGAGGAQHARHMDIYGIMKVKRKPLPPPVVGAGVLSPQPAPLTARNRTIDTVMTDNVRVILPAHGGGAQSTAEEPSLTMALNATFRFALPDECLPTVGGGIEAMEWIAKGPPRVIHLWVYEKRTIMADSLLGDVEIPLGPLTEEDFMDQWLPLRPTPHSSAHKGCTWLVRVQVLLSFLLMCSRADKCARGQHSAGGGGSSASPERTTSSSLSQVPSSSIMSSLLVDGGRMGATDSPALDMGYDDDPNQIKATTMMDDIG